MDDGSMPGATYWSRARHEGAGYDWVLRQLHIHLAPARYLEIGTASGATLLLSNATSLAVDPAFCIAGDVLGKKPALHLMRMTSDAFFAAHDPVAVLGGTVDLAFLDGMHYYQYLLRDFINTERACRPNSLIVMHDCLPHDAFVARRDAADQRFRDSTHEPDWWAGDVWKALAILRERRPDLRIFAVPAPPTGLIVITDLDPSSRVLQDSYFDAVDAVADAGAEVYFRLFDWLPTLPQAAFESLETISRHFWL